MTETKSQETSQTFSHLRGLQRPFYLEANGSNQNNKCFDVRVLISTLHSSQPSGWSWSRACARKPQALIPAGLPTNPRPIKEKPMATRLVSPFVVLSLIVLFVVATPSLAATAGKPAAQPTVVAQGPVDASPDSSLLRAATPEVSDPQQLNSASSQSTLPQSAQSPSANLLTNPGFENGSYSSSATPPGWTGDAWNSASAKFTWDNIQAHSGNKSVKIELTIANDARWIQTAIVQPNTQYLLSGWIKTMNVANTAESVDAGANLSIIGGYIRSAGIFGTTGWRYASLVFNSGSNTQVTVAARLGMYSGTTTGTAWFDDLRLEPLNLVVVSNLLQNPGFESGNLQPSSWTTDALTSSSILTWTGDQFHEGSKSVRVFSSSPNDARWIQTAAVSPHTDYVLTGWIKTANVGHSPESNDIGANLSILGQETPPPDLKGTNECPLSSSLQLRSVLLYNSGSTPWFLQRH